MTTTPAPDVVAKAQAFIDNDEKVEASWEELYGVACDHVRSLLRLIAERGLRTPGTVEICELCRGELGYPRHINCWTESCSLRPSTKDQPQ